MGIDNGLDITDTLALDFTVIGDSRGILLGFESDFGQSFLTTNGQRLGGHMDSALEVGGASGIGRLMALLGNLSEGDEQLYADVMAELDMEPFVAPQIVQLQRAREFASNAGACRTAMDPTDGICIRGSVPSTTLERSGADDGFDFSLDRSASLNLAVDVPIGGDFYVIGGAGYDELGDLDFNASRAITEASGFHGGVGLLKRFDDGNGSASLLLSGGQQSNTTARAQAVFESGIGTASYDLSYVRGTANIGYTLGDGRFSRGPRSKDRQCATVSPISPKRAWRVLGPTDAAAATG